jgi:peptidyl-dipeptidase Dcp
LANFIGSFFFLILVPSFILEARATDSSCGSLLTTKRVSPSARPLLLKWRGADVGLPPFDQVKAADFPEAFQTAIRIFRLQIQRISDNTEPPTFANTVAALERSGDAYDRVSRLYNVWSGSKSDDEFKKVEEELEPLIAAFSDEYIQNGKLFGRIEAVYHSPQKAQLEPEQQRVLEVIYQSFVRNGAQLNAEQKKRVAEINASLADLYRQFRQNVENDEDNKFLLISQSKDLAGLPKYLTDSFAREAERRHQPGQWIVANSRSAMEPFLTLSSNRTLREQAFRIWTTRGDGANESIAKQILELRHERTQIFGSPTYSQWALH